MRLNHLIVTTVSIIFVACLISSCKTARLDREFIDVQNEVNRRLELPKDANSGFQDPKTVDDRVSQILKTENLSSEDLLIMGLLNNPTLQASFQNLGIVHAAFLSARALNNPKVEIMARDSDEEDTDTNWEFTIVQDIMDLIFQPSRVKLSEIEMKRVKLGLAKESMDLALKIKKMVFSYQAEIAKMGLGPKFGQRDTDFIRISRSFLRCLRGML